jgi:hypothetical protein
MTTTTLYLRTTKDKLVDVTDIVPHSVLLNELKEYDDNEPLDVMVGDPDTIHRQTWRAIKAIKMLPELTKTLDTFNNPVKPDDVAKLSLKDMKKHHDTITKMKSKWTELVTENPVYNWLYPLPKYTNSVTCTTDVYSYYCVNTFPTETYTTMYEQCKQGNLNVVQWIYSLGDMNIHVKNESPFRIACFNGHLKMAQWIYSLGGVDIHIVDDSPFGNACINGQLEVAQWIYSLSDKKPFIDNYAYTLIFVEGHLEVAQWLYSLDMFDIHRIGYNMVQKACCGGHMEMIKWLYTLGVNSSYYDNDMFYEQGDETPFTEACENGHLEVAKWLVSFDDDVDIHVRSDWAFRQACTNGHIHIVQWLYSLVDDIHVYDKACNSVCQTSCFICGNKDTEILKWLISLEGVLRKETLVNTFYQVCQYGKIKDAKFLYSLDKVTIDIERSFVLVCASGNLEFAQWLYSLGISRECIKHAFNTAYEHLRLDVSKWLYSLGGMTVVIDNEIFIHACEICQYTFAKWFMSVGGVAFQRIDKTFLDDILYNNRYKQKYQTETEQFKQWIGTITRHRSEVI